ncbi:hypothetical protein RI054_10g51240 [Pseudoscourfieldia marina]
MPLPLGMQHASGPSASIRETANALSPPAGSAHVSTSNAGTGNVPGGSGNKQGGGTHAAAHLVKVSPKHVQATGSSPRRVSSPGTLQHQGLRTPPNNAMQHTTTGNANANAKANAKANASAGVWGATLAAPKFKKLNTPQNQKLRSSQNSGWTWFRTLALVSLLLLLLGAGDAANGLKTVGNYGSAAALAAANLTIAVASNVLRLTAAGTASAVAFAAQASTMQAGEGGGERQYAGMARALRNVTSDVDTAAGLFAEFLRACDAARQGDTFASNEHMPACTLAATNQTGAHFMSLEEEFRAFLSRRAGARASIERVADMVLLLYKWVLPLLLLNAAGSFFKSMGGGSASEAEPDFEQTSYGALHCADNELDSDAAVSPVAVVAAAAAADAAPRPRARSRH